MSTYISIRLILIEITFIIETFNTAMTVNRLDMIYLQHSSVSYNIYYYFTTFRLFFINKISSQHLFITTTRKI